MNPCPMALTSFLDSLPKQRGSLGHPAALAPGGPPATLTQQACCTQPGCWGTQPSEGAAGGGGGGPPGPSERLGLGRPTSFLLIRSEGCEETTWRNAVGAGDCNAETEPQGRGSPLRLSKRMTTREGTQRWGLQLLWNSVCHFNSCLLPLKEHEFVQKTWDIKGASERKRTIPGATTQIKPLLTFTRILPVPSLCSKQRVA